MGGGGWSPESSAALQRFAENWQLPVACAFRFQDAFDNRHPLYVGDVGIGINPTLGRMVETADLLMVVGARLGEMTTDGYQRPPAPSALQRLVHIHAGPEELGRVYRADLLVQASVAVIGKALESLTAPIAAPWLDWLGAGVQAYDKNRESPEVLPMDLAQVVKHLERSLPEDTVYTNGAGNHTGWLHRFLRYPAAYRFGKTQLAPTVGAMGYGLPAAIAASLHSPDRDVVNFSGDGEFLMTSQEMTTAAAWELCTARRGRGRLLVIVVDNGSYGTIRMHQEKSYPNRVSGTSLRNPDFVQLAQAYGWYAEKVSETAGFAAALARALAAGKPALLHLPLDIDVITTRTTLSALREKA